VPLVEPTSLFFGFVIGGIFGLLIRRGDSQIHVTLSQPINHEVVLNQPVSNDLHHHHHPDPEITFEGPNDDDDDQEFPDWKVEADR
jgi:hypothetical protein